MSNILLASYLYFADVVFDRKDWFTEKVWLFGKIAIPKIAVAAFVLILALMVVFLIVKGFIKELRRK